MTKQILIPASVGELLDKVSILRIKKNEIKDKAKLKYVDLEESLLTKTCEENDISLDDQNFKNLYECNYALWRIEDAIRLKERAKSFDEEFVELARQVYLTNDKRFELKKHINEVYKSYLHEEKSYEKYETP
jgi:hypothetical protein